MDLLNYNNLWLPDMLEDAFARGGSKTFAIFRRADGSTDEVSYSAIREDGIALAEKLKAAGLCEGDRLAVITALRPCWFSLLYAALLGGYRMVCIDPGVPDKQIKSMMRQTEIRAVFTSLSRVDLPGQLKGNIPVFAMEPGFPAMGDCEKVNEFMEHASPLPAEDTFFILFSSGTTGENRKGVLLPHTSVTKGIEFGMSTDAGVYKNTTAYSVRKRDLMLFPPYHIAGLLCAVFDIYNNTEIIMLERLTPNALTAAIEELKPDNICTVPSMLTVFMKKIKAALSKKKLLNGLVNVLFSFSGFCRRKLGWKVGRRLLGFLNKKALGGNLDGFMIGASPCDEETMKFFLDMGIDVSLAYGLTELGAPLAATGKGYYLGSTGRVLRHTPEMDIRIVNPDETGKGEVEILSPYRMLTYLKEEDNAGCFTDDGYFKTGDLGYFNKDNCLVLCGRAKEAIVMRNGEKLLPEEIEKFYQNVSSVGELCVFRVPDEGGCDTFAIAAIKEKEKGLPEDVVRMYIWDRADKVPPMYRPKEVYIVNEFPLSSTHKIQRFRLTEMAVEGKNAPTTEEEMKRIDEDDTVAELRELLVKVGGPQWKTEELTEGLPLNMDSLTTMELFVSIQDHFGVDLFKLAKAPETFGELRKAVTEYDTEDKNDKPDLDLSQFPQPVSKTERAFFGGTEKFAKFLWNVHGSGLENLPADTNYVICSNHITVLDPGWICSCMTRAQRANTAIVGKSELVNDSALKNFVRSHNLIPVDRTGNSLATLNRCKELLEEGWNILIFPEGTNYENARKLMKLKEGPARLAISTGKPIIPVHIKGLREMDMDKRGFLPPVGGRIDVVFGKPILPDGLTPAQINEILKTAIEEL